MGARIAQANTAMDGALASSSPCAEDRPIPTSAQCRRSSLRAVIRWVAMRKIVLAYVLVLAAVFDSAWAESITGVVVGVTDGDSITLLDERLQQHKVRLAGIDAPEKR